MSCACSTWAAPSELNDAPRDCRKYKMNSPAAASSRPAALSSRNRQEGGGVSSATDPATALAPIALPAGCTEKPPALENLAAATSATRLPTVADRCHPDGRS